MATLDDLKAGARVRGLLPEQAVTIKSVQRYGKHAAEVVFADATRRLDSRLVSRDDEPSLELVDAGRRWSFDGDGDWLVSEAKRLHLASLFDPYLAVSTSVMEPLAMEAVMHVERELGREPRDVSDQRGLGDDIVSRDPTPGALVFAEVKGIAGSDQVCLSRNEILCARNEPEKFRLAIVRSRMIAPGRPYTCGASTSGSRGSG